MSNRQHLRGDLQCSVPGQSQKAIIEHMWPGASSCPMATSEFSWDAYFSFYSRECNSALIDEGKYFCAREHQDMVRLMQFLLSEPDKATVWERIRQSLTAQRLIEEENCMVHCSTIVAIRLLAMVNIGSLPHEIPNSRVMMWKDGSLRDAIHEHFTVPQEFDAGGVFLELDFTARNFQRMAGMDVIWTDNLADHLRLVHKDRKVCIFHHITFLRWMKRTNSTLYPAGLIQETLETLTLLFPSKDRKAKRWLVEQIAESGRVDRRLKEAGNMKRSHRARRLEHYIFWRDRLGTLQEAYDEATPPSKALLKALTDRKRGDSWINSWVAIVAICFTLFFGLVQSIEGAIQVYKAYHAANSS